MLLHHDSIASLRESAQVGCLMCHLFDNTFRKEALDNIDAAGQLIITTSHNTDMSIENISLICETSGLLFYSCGSEQDEEVVEFEAFQFEGQSTVQSKVECVHTQS